MVVQSPLQYFKMLFTDEMIQHVAHTNLYSAKELGDPIKTSPEEIEDLFSMLLFMGVFKFPSLEDYWNHESHFSVIADIMSRKRFQKCNVFLCLNANQECFAAYCDVCWFLPWCPVFKYPGSQRTEHDQNKKCSRCEQFLCVVSLLISLES